MVPDKLIEALRGGVVQMDKGSGSGEQDGGLAAQRDFGEALQKRRKELSLSQIALAKAIGGVGQSAISQWECGQTAPRPHHVYKAEAVLGLSPGTLSRLLGYLPPGSKPRVVSGEVREAIRRDPVLTSQEKRSFITLYNAIAAGRSLRDS